MEKEVVTTIAGNPLFKGFADGDHLTARFNSPIGIAVDSKNNVYVSDRDNHRIRKITPQGVVTTIAGSGKRGYSDHADPLRASFNSPSGIAFDREDNMYICDTENHTIRKMDNFGLITTIAGNGTAGFVDGKSTTARFFSPSGIVVDSKGDLFVTDRRNHAIRKVVPSTCEVTTFAGNGTKGFCDGKTGLFKVPIRLAIDERDNLYVVDYGNNRIRKITPQSVVSTMAGTDVPGFRDGKAEDAQFNAPMGIAIDSKGIIAIADSNNHRVRRLWDGTVTCVAGDGTSGSRDGRAGHCQFNDPRGLVFDSFGNLFVADCRNNVIRKIEASAIRPLEEDRNKGLRILENDLSKLLHMTELCDFTIKVKDRDFGVHKPLLKARCPIIFSLLTEDNVLIEELDGVSFEKVIEFIYCGNCSLEVLSVNSLFSTLVFAEKLMLDRLRAFCETTILERISLVNVIDIVNIAEQLQRQTILKRGIWFIIAHYTELKPSLGSLSQNLLLEILDAQRSTIRVENVEIPPNNLSEHLSILFESQADCDLIIHVGNDKIGVHKAILAARCRFFEGMFRRGFSESAQTDIHHDTKLNFTSFTSLLRYFYTGNTNFGVSDAVAILQESEFYMLDDNMLEDPFILKQCSEILKEKLAPDNCVEIFELASKYHFLKLKEEALDMIVADFEVFQKKVQKHPDSEWMNQILLEVVNELIKKNKQLGKLKH